MMIAVSEVDGLELACRILEGLLDESRPEGSTAQQVLDGVEPDTRLSAMRAARRAFDYLQECLKRAETVQ